VTEAGGPAGHQWPNSFEKYVEENKTLQNWIKVLIIPIYKNGEEKMQNYGVITLHSHCLKV
jgi:hypothetical protein